MYNVNDTTNIIQDLGDNHMEEDANSIQDSSGNEINDMDYNMSDDGQNVERLENEIHRIDSLSDDGDLDNEVQGVNEIIDLSDSDIENGTSDKNIIELNSEDEIENLEEEEYAIQREFESNKVNGSHNNKEIITELNEENSLLDDDVHEIPSRSETSLNGTHYEVHEFEDSNKNTVGVEDYLADENEVEEDQAEEEQIEKIQREEQRQEDHAEGDLVKEQEVDEGQAYEGQVDEGQSDEGHADEGHGHADEGQADEGQADEGQADEGQTDEIEDVEQTDRDIENSALDKKQDEFYLLDDDINGDEKGRIQISKTDQDEGEISNTSQDKEYNSQSEESKVNIHNEVLPEVNESKSESESESESEYSFPIIINIADTDFLLVPFSKNKNPNIDVSHLVSLYDDYDVLKLTIEEFFGLVRTNEDLNEIYEFTVNKELVLVVPELNDLSITEDNIYSRDVTIEDFVKSFDNLKSNSNNVGEHVKNNSICFLLTSQTRFITNFNNISETIRSGKGFDSISKYNDIEVKSWNVSNEAQKRHLIDATEENIEPQSKRVKSSK